LTDLLGGAHLAADEAQHKLVIVLDQPRRIDKICAAESLENVLHRNAGGQQARRFRRDLELRNSATLDDHRRDAVQPIEARL
jgi:hypothetical protein